MSSANVTADVVIIGGGFYGCELALAFRRLGMERVILAERELGILRRASFANQARVHNGYHYPRSYSTAMRSHINFQRFIESYPHATLFEMEMVYAIGRGSRVSAAQFETFCSSIGAPCFEAPGRLSRLFDRSLVEATFTTLELAFNVRALAEKLMVDLSIAKVDLRLGAVAQILEYDQTGVNVMVGGRNERASYVLNCTYSELEYAGVPLRAKIKKELTEMVLVLPPPILRKIGVTVMDGPFFSAMPFPAMNLHTLSHVRYTPHGASVTVAPKLGPETRSRRVAMIRDAARFMPILEGAKPIGSIFEVKAILVRNEDDDGRPILIEEHENCPRVLSVLGSKIDNIFDALQYVSSRSWNS